MAHPRTSLATFLVASGLVLAGCQAPPSNQDGRHTIGYDVYWLGNSWSVQMREEFTAAVARHPGEIAEVVYTESDNNAQRQISNVQSMIARKVDVIMLTPISPAAVAPVIKQAKAANIPVILVGAPAQGEEYASLVNIDDAEFGRRGARWLADKLGGKGEIYVLNGLPGISVNEQRWQGAREIFAQYPGIIATSTANADWDQAKAKAVVADMLAAKPGVAGVWSQGGAMTLGAIQAFQAAGRGLVPMTGEDFNGLLKQWSTLNAQGGTGFDSIAVSKPTWLSAEALEVALKVLTGEQVPRDHIVAPPTITAGTLGQYVRPDLPDSFWSQTRLDDAAIRKLFGR